MGDLHSLFINGYYYLFFTVFFLFYHLTNGRVLFLVLLSANLAAAVAALEADASELMEIMHRRGQPSSLDAHRALIGRGVSMCPMYMCRVLKTHSAAVKLIIRSSLYPLSKRSSPG